jgi:SAM-dependent methyltransferase
MLLRDRDGKIRSESAVMRALRKLGRDDVAWPLRRLHVPVTRDALVLEVGSGGNPFSRANVLLDAYEVTRERHFEALVRDRPFVLGMVERLPFRDDAFDFVIACHVIEHAIDVESCLREMQRVAKAGYVECPDAFFERINPYSDHRLEITQRNGELRIAPKPRWIKDPELVELYEAQVKPTRRWMRHLRENAFAFHMRLFWSREDGGIRYRLVEPLAAGEQQFDGGGESQAPNGARSRGPRELVRDALRRGLSQSRRNRAIDVVPLLRCVECGTGRIERSIGERICCFGCGAEYSTQGGVPRMHRKSNG